MCSFDAELGKIVYHVDWPGHLHDFFFLACQVTIKGPGNSISNKTMNNHE